MLQRNPLIAMGALARSAAEIAGRFMPSPWMVLAALVPALILGLGLTPTRKVDAAGVNSMRAESTLWVYDHRSGEGYRAADGRWNGLEQFATAIPMGYWPRQVRHAYGFDQLGNDGAGQIIGISGAFHYPTAGADLQHFIRTFGLKEMYGLPGKNACTVTAGPHPCFEIVYASGSQPAVNELWALESALDTQWAHAIAPGADILLVEAATNSIANQIQATDVAAFGGATVVSMSWGIHEFNPEGFIDHHFSVTGVTFVAASGDFGHGVIWPAVSPFVLAVGGTTLHLDSNGNRTGPEIAWSSSGGGISQVEPEPAYQSSYPIPATGGARGNPDVAFNGDPTTGQAVFDSTGFNGQKGWFVLAGTSIAAPQWAGLIALANELRSAGNLSSNDLGPLYQAAAADVYEDNYIDIRKGSNGSCGTICTAGPGYDFVTGLGSPRANDLVPVLAGREE